MSSRLSQIWEALNRITFGTSPPLRSVAGLVSLYKAIGARSRSTLRLPFQVVGARAIPRTEALSYGNIGKVLETAVLYVDIRHSTLMHITTDPRTVARILKAFLREMAQIARYYGAFIRGFAGDRIMVITEQEPDAPTKAIDIAVAMRDTVRKILNRVLAENGIPAISVGIGIDYGVMLAIKVGMQRTLEHSDLVWIGVPANVASKLTDEANLNEVLVSRAIHTRLDPARYAGHLWSSRNVTIAGLQVTAFALADHVSFGEPLRRAGFP